ncbi:lipopolysaccharide biosynthesis protein [Mucilaginibacter calamicampi]|uniref:Lipopolysaccharide biosynthesis protein n=1 Tax=Mucilaginibacter calamicampi TaxID=1302352 RepID=A0ABW2YYN4_9SPHI
MVSENALESNALRKKEELSLKELILKISKITSYLFSKWRIIVLVSFLCASIGVCLAFFSKIKYIADSTFVLEEGENTGGVLGQYSGLASMVGIDVGGANGLFHGDNILELYKSRQMIQKALLSNVKGENGSNSLLNSYFKINELDKNPKIAKLDFSVQESFGREQDSVLQNVVDDIRQNYLAVNRPDKKLSIIKVEVTSNDEHFSKVFNDEIVKTVNDFYVQTKTKKALQNLTILQHTADSVKSVLNNAISTTAEVSDATPNLNPNRQILRTRAQRSQFSAEANKAILSQIVQNLELAKISLRRETPLIQIIDNPTYPLQKKGLGKFKGLIIGGFAGAFLCIMYLTLVRVAKNIMS